MPTETEILLPDQSSGLVQIYQDSICQQLERIEINESDLLLRTSSSPSSQEQEIQRLVWAYTIFHFKKLNHESRQVVLFNIHANHKIDVLRHLQEGGLNNPRSGVSIFGWLCSKNENLSKEITKDLTIEVCNSSEFEQFCIQFPEQLHDNFWLKIRQNEALKLRLLKISIKWHSFRKILNHLCLDDQEKQNVFQWVENETSPTFLERCIQFSELPLGDHTQVVHALNTLSTVEGRVEVLMAKNGKGAYALALHSQLDMLPVVLKETLPHQNIVEILKARNEREEPVILAYFRKLPNTSEAVKAVKCLFEQLSPEESSDLLIFAEAQLNRNAPHPLENKCKIQEAIIVSARAKQLQKGQYLLNLCPEHLELKNVLCELLHDLTLHLKNHFQAWGIHKLQALLAIQDHLENLENNTTVIFPALDKLYWLVSSIADEHRINRSCWRMPTACAKIIANHCKSHNYTPPSQPRNWDCDSVKKALFDGIREKDENAVKTILESLSTNSTARVDYSLL